jgi:hypothetical protein
MKLVARLVIVATLVAVGATGCASLDGWQRKAIFQHTASDRFVHIAVPDGAETYDLALANGDKLHTWYLRAGVADAPTVLFLHGARRNLNGSATIADSAAPNRSCPAKRARSRTRSARSRS